MGKTNRRKFGWRQRITRELVSFGITFIYLAVIFGAFATYRRLILAEYEISYLQYGVSVIEALLLTKIIQVGDRLRLGQQIEYRSLIYPTVYKSVVYTIWVGIFQFAKHAVSELARGEGGIGDLDELKRGEAYAFLAKCLVLFCAFLPFFAFKELARVLGTGRISALFFRRKVIGILDLPPVRIVGMRRKSNLNGKSASGRKQP